MQKTVGSFIQFSFLFSFILVPLLGRGQSAAETVYLREKAAWYQEKALGQDHTRPALALQYADSVELLALSLRDSSWLYKAYKLKGDINHHKGELPQALLWLKKALDLSRELNDTLFMVKAYNNLGGVYFNAGKFDKALHSFSQANLLGDEYLDTAQKATILSNIGLVYKELGQYSEALAYYQQSLSLHQKGSDAKNRGIVHNNLGGLYTRLNEVEEAFAHFRLARKLGEEAGNENGVANALNGLAVVYLEENPEISIEYLRLAKKLYLKNNNKAGLYRLNKQAGETYLVLKNYSHAQIHFEEALAYADSLDNSFLRGQTLLKMAALQEQQGKFEEASRLYKEYVATEKEVYNKNLMDNIARTKADYELSKKENQLRDLTEQAAVTSSLLRQRTITLTLLALLSLLTVVFAFFLVRRYWSSQKANHLLKAKNRLVSSQKQEIELQHQLIQRKKEELEEATHKNDQYNQELLKIKEKLEEKVKDRTKELEEIYIKLSFHIHNTPLAVLEWNSRRELTHWPKQAESIFGYTAEEMLGLQIEEVPFVLPDDRQEVLDTIEQLSQGDLSQQYITRQHIDRYGNVRYIEWSYSVLLNEEGQLESILTIANDVSLREQTYRELKSANQELDTFLYKSSHDLRGPIARMQGIINLGLIETKEESARMYYNMLNKVTDELNNLLLRLLMVHNINQHSYEAEEINFHAFVESIMAAYTGRKRSNQSVELINKIPQDMLLQSDKTLLNIVLVNLLENGLMFADNFHPRMEFDALYLPSGKYIILVTDNGMGIPEQFREKIFDMFFQGSTRSTGAGLGLYMVRKATKKMGGDVRLTSENGKTVFEIALPAAQTRQNKTVEVLN